MSLEHEGKIQIVTDLLKAIGENPDRKGLKETPSRVVRSWDELYSGYGADVSKIFTIFDDEPCGEMVLLKNCEMYSTCEHHILPFFGKVHIAYIPNGNKVVGISKLARLVEIYSRRLQIQERLTNQITQAIEKHLEPQGVACVIEATHFCMRARGVQKQNSIMITSSLTGAFKENATTREEFMRLIK